MATVYTGMNLFDGNDVENKAGSWMLVGDDGRIESVGTGTAPAADATVDLTGKYVMPGLINCHTHTMLDAYDPKLTMFSETEIAFRGIKHLKALIDCGVTTIRECASAFSVDCKLAALQRKGELADMPTIVPSGRSMSMTGGHGDMQMGLEGESNGSHLVDSPDEMRKAVREEFKLGAKNIKMMATGGVMSPTDQIDDTELTVEEMKVAVEEAHHKHMTVCAHAEGANGIHNAIVAGVDSIEHGAMIRDEDIQLMIKNGQYLTPTLIACWAIPEYGEGKIPQFMVDKARGFEKDYFTNIGKAAKAGVKFSMGTDAGTPFNDFGDTPYELVLMKQVGCTTEQVLHSCGRNAADLLKVSADYGTLEPGKYADFLVLDADPIADVAAVGQKDKAVYKHGVRVH